MTHIIFVDDVLIFSIAKDNKVKNLFHNLDDFGEKSGLKLNESKTQRFICQSPVEAKQIT